MYKIVNGKRVYDIIEVVSYVPQETEEGESFVDYSKRIVNFTLENTTWGQALRFCKNYYGAKNVHSRLRMGEIVIYYKVL